MISNNILYRGQGHKCSYATLDLVRGNPLNPFLKPLEIMEEKRNKTIRFRVNHSEYESINKRADGSVSDWLRTMALNKKPKRKAKPIDPQLIYELNKIGANINQIARHLNQIADNNADKAKLLLAFIAIEDHLKALREKYDS